MATTALLTGGTAAVASADREIPGGDRMEVAPMDPPAGEPIHEPVEERAEEPMGEPLYEQASEQARGPVHEGVWTTRAKPVNPALRRVKRMLRASAARGGSFASKSFAFHLVTRRSWPRAQFRCLDRLWTRESNWNHRAMNRSSGAYGIPQALPASKMRSSGHDWRFNPKTQIRWGLRYIKSRYGTPCAAWAHSQSHGWY